MLSYLLSACALPGDAFPVVKVGVIAPFEGAGRPLGYAVLPAAKKVIEEANGDGRLGRYRVMLVAFNDDQHGPTSAAQAQALALDPAVVAVLGPWTAGSAAAVEPILAAAGLPRVASERVAIPPAGAKWDDVALAQAAALAGADAQMLLAALATDIRMHGRPTRTGVKAALP